MYAFCNQGFSDMIERFKIKQKHNSSLRKISMFCMSLIVTFSAGNLGHASSPIPGTKCTKAGIILEKSGKRYTCIKLGKNLFWNNGKSIQSKKKPEEVKVIFRKDLSYCVPSFTIGNVQCSLWGIWSYGGNVPKTIQGEIFALADGKIFKALSPQSQDEFSYADFTFSPGTRVKGGASFEFPSGVYVQKFFISQTYDIRKAVLSFNIGAYVTEEGLV